MLTPTNIITKLLATSSISGHVHIYKLTPPIDTPAYAQSQPIQDQPTEEEEEGDDGWKWSCVAEFGPEEIGKGGGGKVDWNATG
jgi:hypothetical protein